MSKKKIPITLLCGYLGAGKTTLLNKVLTNQKGYKVAVIVNDIGEINIDERLISKEAQITDSSSLVPLTNGCICCTLKTDMVQQIENLMQTGKFDYILIEASGVCEPMPIAQAIEQIEIGKLDKQCIIVTKDFITGSDIRMDDIKKLTCTVYRIKKAPSFDPNDLSTIRTIISKIQ